MHLLLVTHYFEPENSAPQRRWAAFIERFVAAGCTVDVYCPPPHYPTGRIPQQHRRAYRVGSVSTPAPGVRVKRVGFLPHRGDLVTRTLDHAWAAFSTYVTVLATVARTRRRPDVIIATAPAIESLTAGRTLARHFGVPIIVEMRDAWPDLVTHVPTLTTRSGVSQWVKSMIHKLVTSWQTSSDAVVTTTQRFADVLEGRGVPRPAVIRNGTTPERYGHLAHGPEPHEGLRVLYMGNLGRSQGLDIAIEAAAQLRSTGVPIELRLIGYGADRTRLQQLNASLGSPATILDQVPSDEVVGHYEWADSLLVSLRAWGPFEWTVPSKLYEALATGRHITAVLGGEAAEIVAETGAGHIVAPGESDDLAALWAMLAVAPDMLRIDARGREWASEFASYDGLAAQYLEVLERVVPSRGTRSNDQDNEPES